jgi:hypothetical protein
VEQAERYLGQDRHGYPVPGNGGVPVDILISGVPLPDQGPA